MNSNMIFKAESIDDIWMKLWEAVKDGIKEQESRDGNVVWECIDAHIIMTNPTRNLSHNKVRDMSIRYAIGEYLWYESASNLLKPIQAFTKGWDRMSDDGIHVNSNYGHLIKKKYGFDQFDMCHRELLQAPQSRRAVLHYKYPFDFVESPSKDVPCTLSQQFIIRDGALHSIVNMRSNDIWNGIPYDIFFFTSNQIKMAMLLNIPIGMYMHNAGSLHMYKRDYETALANESKLSDKNKKHQMTIKDPRQEYLIPSI